MLTINNITLSADYKTMNVVLTTDAGSDQLNLTLFIQVGTCYLSENPGVDVTHRLEITPGSEIVTAAIPIADISSNTGEIANNCEYDKDIFDGIFSIQASDIVLAIDQYDEKPVINPYYMSLVLGHRILDIDSNEKLNETNLVHLLLQASISYVAQEETELALSAYSRVEILNQSAPQEWYKSELAPRGVGVGCWIVDGVYVKF